MVFPYVLVRLPVVPRSALHHLGYERTLAWRRLPDGERPSPEQAFLEDSERCDPETIRLLQWPPFLDALRAANPELGRRVAGLGQVPAAMLRKKERQTLRAALRYLWRAALRPIPHGGLCCTALALREDTWPEPPPDLSNRKSIRTLASSAVTAAAQLAWGSPSATRRSRLYLSPLVWTGTDAKWRYWDATLNTVADVSPPLLPLLESLRREPGLFWGDAAKLAGEEPTIRTALQSGTIERYASAPGEDEREALRRVLWQGTFEDLNLLEPLAQLSPEPGQSEGRTDPVKSDSFYPSLLGLAEVPGMPAFLTEIACLGARIADPVSCEARIAAELLRRIAPSGQPLPLLEFYAGCRRLAREHGVEFAGPEDWGALAAAMAIDTGEQQTPIRAWMDADGSGGPVAFPLPPRWRAAPVERRRTSVRFRRTRAGRFFLAHFGSDRMSLLPRYERLPFDDRGPFQREVREWMGRWPEVWELYGGTVHDADAHDPLTPRVIHFPGTPPPPGSVALAALMVAARPEDGAPILTAADGVRIRPAFFGVTAEHALPAILRFTLSVGNPEMTVLEGVCRALRNALAEIFRNLQGRLVELPEVTLGETIVLSPRLWIVPAQSLPEIAAPVNAAAFVAFHDWLARMGMPSRLVQAARPGKEAQWLDLGNPEGVNNLLRIFRSSEVVIVCDSLLEHDEDGLRSANAWYEPEYYAEVSG
jgi:hypothetical protein